MKLLSKNEIMYNISEAQFKKRKNEKLNKQKFDSFIEVFNKSKDFINNNVNGILLNTTKIQLKVKISIVIPCLNCKKYI